MEELIFAVRVTVLRRPVECSLDHSRAQSSFKENANLSHIVERHCVGFQTPLLSPLGSNSARVEVQGKEDAVS